MSEFEARHSIYDIPQQHWDALYQRLQPAGYPFLDYRFLAALEDSGCIGAATDHPSGWQPCYLTDSRHSLIVPTFVKQHSYAEYVFDWSWAEAYQRYGLAYYPKLLWAMPFTPASGPRLLGDPQDLSRAMDWVQAYTEGEQLSGWHLNFTDQETTDYLQSQTAPAHRQGCQFHWFNRDYQSFDHYLQHFVSRKRKSVRKERQRVKDQGIDVVRKTAADISPQDMDFFYRCYQNTYHQRGSYPYLNREFFRRLQAGMADKLLLVVAAHQGEPVAAALYFFDSQTLYGRYWGAVQEFDALHFEACYYQGIEFCIEHKLQRFDPGTQGEHKISRGFEPVYTHSFHQLQQLPFQDAVQEFAAQERQHVEHYFTEASTLTPFHRNPDGPDQN